MKWQNSEHSMICHVHLIYTLSTKYYRYLPIFTFVKWLGGPDDYPHNVIELYLVGAQYLHHSNRLIRYKTRHGLIDVVVDRAGMVTWSHPRIRSVFLLLVECCQWKQSNKISFQQVNLVRLKLVHFKENKWNLSPLGIWKRVRQDIVK